MEAEVSLSSMNRASSDLYNMISLAKDPSNISMKINSKYNVRRINRPKKGIIGGTEGEPVRFVHKAVKGWRLHQLLRKLPGAN